LKIKETDKDTQLVLHITETMVEADIDCYCGWDTANP